MDVQTKNIEQDATIVLSAPVGAFVACCRLLVDQTKKMVSAAECISKVDELQLRFLLFKYCVGSGFTHLLRACPRDMLCQHAGSVATNGLAADLWRSFLISSMKAFANGIELSPSAVASAFPFALLIVVLVIG
jgi:hypothetical protein